ncbi:MAG: choice-of-anchor D domain-containing protein [Alphaproteobacteria bacterium]|nr:choice-of-anchor D domain-containing protein [Alphaproteobacteria bacterium]
MRLIPVLLLALGLGAQCSDNEINPINPDDDVELAPEIVVDPLYIDFGEARVGEVLSADLVIRNEGTDNLEIEAVRLEAGQGFEMIPIEPQTLAPDAEVKVTVRFSPVTVDHEGRVVVVSDDPGATNTVVPLTGYGLIPKLYAYPSPYDFGIVEPECTREGFVTLQNIGRETLTIDGLAQIGGDFILDPSTATLPIVLAPNESTDVRLEFTPLDVLAYDGELWITSDGGDSIIQETGEGGAALPFTDEWRQPVSNVSDIFFYVDQSCSMVDDQERMINEFRTFITELQDVEADYQIFVATRDSGCNNMAGPITPDTPFDQAVSQFQYGVTYPNPDGQYTEAGFMIIRQALSEQNRAGCNAALLRDNAIMNWVLVSDEPEQSPPSFTWNQAVPYILSQAPGSYIHTIVGPLPNGCETAEPGTGYIEASGATGGLNRSICDTNWGDHLTQLAELATVAHLADTFYLTHDPQPETIEVYVEGEKVEEGWRYNEEANTIVFDEDAIPGEGEQVSALYYSGFACD